MKRYHVNHFMEETVEDPEGAYVLYSEVAKIKADAIREAVKYTNVVGQRMDQLLAYADNLEDK